MGIAIKRVVGFSLYQDGKLLIDEGVSAKAGEPLQAFVQKGSEVKYITYDGRQRTIENNGEFVIQTVETKEDNDASSRLALDLKNGKMTKDVVGIKLYQDGQLLTTVGSFTGKEPIKDYERMGRDISYTDQNNEAYHITLKISGDYVLILDGITELELPHDPWDGKSMDARQAEAKRKALYPVMNKSSLDK